MKYPIFYINMKRRGRTHGPVTFIQKGLEDVLSLHAHEAVHRKWWAFVSAVSTVLFAGLLSAVGGPLGLCVLGLGTHPALYAVWRRYREKSEIAAKVASIRFADDTPAQIKEEAESLANNYRMKRSAAFYENKLAAKLNA